MHLSEDRNSVASSEDSGISSSNSDEISQIVNAKDNHSLHSPNSIISYPRSTHNNVEIIKDRNDLSIISTTGNLKDLSSHIPRPNSATTDISNSSETETSEGFQNLRLRLEQENTFEEKVIQMQLLKLLFKPY